MSRSASLGVVTEFMALPRQTLLATTLVATCAMGAMVQQGINQRNLLGSRDSASFVKNVIYPNSSTARNHADPSLKRVNYRLPSPADDVTSPITTGVGYADPVLAGNYPDPSAVRVGQDYWATATSSGWAPHFPIMHSRDLANWEIVGSVFNERPAWSDGNYWAPEITQYRDRSFVYYVAHQKADPAASLSPPLRGLLVLIRITAPWSVRRWVR